jgi:hypothetical protein
MINVVKNKYVTIMLLREKERTMSEREQMRERGEEILIRSEI